MSSQAAVKVCAGTPTLGGQVGELPPLPFPWGEGRGKIALYAELFLSLLSCKGAFTGVVDRLVAESFLEASPRSPTYTCILMRPIY